MLPERLPAARLPERLAAVLADPPRSFSPVPIWWWSGEALDAERLRWQLERFAEGGIYNLVVLNLAPSGPAHGADPDDPPFLSERWWDLFLGACDDAKRLGISLWFYDQLGFSGADLQARLVARHPEYAGRRLHRLTVTATGAGRLKLRCPAGGRPVGAAVEVVDEAGRPAGPPEPVPLTGTVATWQAHSPGFRLSLYYDTDHGFDYLAPTACATLLDQVHAEFARRLGDRLGTVVVGSFQDELPALPTWSATFAAEFTARYGYDLRTRLGALWDAVLPDADRVRRDYHALRATLAETAFFRPLAQWHDRHGLLVGCDQQDPARAGHPVEGASLYADYPRTHRWFSAPGSDHHGDARIHSSLAHLYDQPRVWIEAFHSTGWGGTLEETLDWLLPWLRTGATLYNPHAVYYSTKAGWWEWAPPATDWRQPYWRHHREFADTVTRLCAALSLGRHTCEVAVLHPTTTAQADLRLDGAGPAATRAQAVYRELIGDAAWFAPVPGVLDLARLDADVIDDDSLASAEVRGRIRGGPDGVTPPRLCVAGEEYAAVVLPAATVLEEATARRLDEFVVAGGLLVAVGALPERGVCTPTAAAPATDPGPAGTAADEVVARLRERFVTGAARFVRSAADLPGALVDLTPRVVADVPVLARDIDGALTVFVTATAWSATEVDGRPEQRGPGHGWDNVGYDFDPARYLSEVRVRVRHAPGAPVLASPFGAPPRPLPYTVDGVVTEVVVPFSDGPAALLVFPPGTPPAASAGAPPPPAGSPAVPPAVAAEHRETLPLDGEWLAELVPTLDNRWGDFAWPPSVATDPVVQRWELEHRRDGVDGWQPGLATFGPHGLVGNTPVTYSASRGIRKDPIHRPALGPKGHVPEEFLDFGQVRAGTPVRFRAEFTLTDADLTGIDPDRLSVAVGAPAAKRLWLDGAPVPIDDGGGHLGIAPVRLAAGRHELELELVPATDLALRAHLAFVRDLDRYRRPEWITVDGLPEPGRRIAFGTTVTLDRPASGAALNLTALGSARLLVNGVEAGRQGGFAPYERPIPSVRRYELGRVLRPGANEVVVELTAPSPILVDAVVDGHGSDGHGSDGHGPDGHGPAFGVVSDTDWWATVDGTPARVVRHRRAHRVVADLYVTRRPHPLPGAAWLDDTDQADTVVPVTFAAPRPPGERVEWLRLAVPPGATRLDLRVVGDADLYVDDMPVDAYTGVGGTGPDSAGPDGGVSMSAELPSGARAVQLRIQTRPGYEAGAALTGPARFTVGPGRLDFGDWEQHGLAGYSGGVRYRRTVVIPPDTRDARLDLGRVRGSAEVTVDGRSVGVRFCAPYVFDLGPLAPGEHTVDVEVFGTLAPYLDTVSPTHFVFPGQRVSGLFGPVRLHWASSDR
jgi:hypothetical protein